MSRSPDAPPRGHRILQRIAPRLALVGLIVWWWPSLTRQGDATNVLLGGDREVVADSNPVIRRLHERGLSVAVEADWSTWCDALAGLSGTTGSSRHIGAATVVLSFRSEGTCVAAPGGAVRAVVDLLADHDIVVVRSMQGPAEPAVDDTLDDLALHRKVTIADAGRLLGDPTNESMPCQWWDDCRPDGTVAVREPDGKLTRPGLERVARQLTAVVP